ncbi:MAG: SgcJ/EcaC family oxidoreductase [Variovorax sp.]|nr:MAG: SgcJ/EcaC family oxidoreductase [Variovorax sp.]
MSGRASEGRAVLGDIQRRWTAAASPWNANALAAVYAEDALFFGGRPGHSVGRGAILEYFASYEGVIESGTLELVDQQVVELAPRCLLAQGYGEFAFVLAGARETRSLLRTTLVLRLQQGRWEILQHHFSASPLAPPLGDS